MAERMGIRVLEFPFKETEVSKILTSKTRVMSRVTRPPPSSAWGGSCCSMGSRTICRDLGAGATCEVNTWRGSAPTCGCSRGRPGRGRYGLAMAN